MRTSCRTSDLIRARGGDPRALERLLEAVTGRLRALAARRLGPRLRARVGTSDVLQSTFLDVVRSLHRFEGDDMEQFVAWSSCIMENNIRDEDKYHHARKRHERGMTFDLRDAHDVATDREDPRGHVRRAEELLQVLDALDRLPDDYRRVIVLRVGQGLSHRQIADILGRSESAVRMLLCRARATLVLSLEAAGAG